MKDISYLTRKGQTTIPAHIRKELGLKQGQGLRYQLNRKTGAIELEPLADLRSLFGAFKSKKKYDPQKAREQFLDDLIKRDF